jgi:hypothetical protein
MTMAANLTQAAGLSYAQASLAWTALTLKTKLTTFIGTASALFEDAVPDDRSVGNWLVLMTALATEMVAASVSETQFDTCVEYLYRICFAAATAQAQSRITAAQGNALLVAWNTNFGT